MAFEDLFGKKKEVTKEDRIREEKNSIEVRKSTAISVHKQEVDELLAQRQQLYMNIGAEFYSLWKNSKPIPQENDKFEKIKEIELDIKAKEEKNKERIAQYDEEIEIMNKQLASLINEAYSNMSQSGTQNARNVATDNVGFCSNCGKPIVRGNAFCVNCGKPL